MTLANFTFIAFIIISVIIFLMLYMLMRQIKIDGRLPTEKRRMLGAILFIPAILIFILVFKQITNWRTNIKHAAERIELNNFVYSIYKPLIASQKALLDEEKRMQHLLKTVRNIGLDHPNHAQLIGDIIEKWKVETQELVNAYIATDRGIRLAWISYKTGDQQDVRAKFAKQAVRLEEYNKRAEKKYRNAIYSIQDKLIKSLDSARRLLDANRRPPRKKKYKRINKQLRESIVPFNDSVVSKLIIFLGDRIDQRLRIEVEKLQKIIRDSGQQSILVRNHLQKNPDLAGPLTTTINSWLLLEHNSRKRLKQILYAIEAEYIARILELPERDTAIRAMHKSLRNNVSYIVGKALKDKKSIKQSYNIAPRKKR